MDKFGLKFLLNEESGLYIYIDLLNFDDTIKKMKQEKKIKVNEGTQTSHIKREYNKAQYDEFTYDDNDRVYKSGCKVLTHNIFEICSKDDLIQIEVNMKYKSIHKDDIISNLDRERMLYIVIGELEFDIYELYKTWVLFEGDRSSKDRKYIDLHNVKMCLYLDKMQFIAIR